MRKNHIYLAGPFFNEQQCRILDAVQEALQQNATVGEIFSPSQWQGAKNLAFGSTEWKQKTFLADIRQIDRCDAVVAIADYTVLEGETLPDSGTTFEMGYAYATNKPLIIVHAEDMNKLNLMLLEAQTSIQSIDTLASYDFNTLHPNIEMEQKLEVF